MGVAVIGAGTVGLTLARAWRHAGLEVTVAVRDPDDARHDAVREELPLATVEQAVPAAEATAIAVPGSALAALASSAAGVLDGRLLIDATNATAAPSLHQLPMLRQTLPAARIFRAFATLGWENVATPTFELDGREVPADLFYCGPDGADAATVERLVAADGLRPVRIGDLDAADTLDGVARLWFALALGQGRGRHLAFKLLT